MQQSCLSNRGGPIIGLVGSAIVLIYSFLLPPREWNGTPWQGYVDPMGILVLLTALAVLILNAVALFLPPSPLLGGLGLYAASVGLLAQLYPFLVSFIDTGATVANLPQLFSVLGSFVLGGSWLLLLGFLLSIGAMALTALQAEQQASVTLHRNPLPAFPRTELPANQMPSRERTGATSSRRQEGEEQVSVWSTGRRHILALIVGLLLSSVLSNLFILWEVPGDGNAEIVFPVFVLVLFFGVVYGPWVGLVTGGGGMFLNNAISSVVHAPYWILTNYGAFNSVPLDISHPRVYWPLVVGNALVGLLAGLPLFGVAGRDKTVRSLLAVMLRSACALVVGLSLSVVSAQVGHPRAMILLAIQESFTFETIPTLLVVVLLLPVVLLLSPLRSTRRRERSTLAF